MYCGNCFGYGSLLCERIDPWHVKTSLRVMRKNGRAVTYPKRQQHVGVRGVASLYEFRILRTDGLVKVILRGPLFTPQRNRL